MEPRNASHHTREGRRYESSLCFRKLPATENRSNQNGLQWFSEETLKFLIDLRTNNSKKWFDANRQSYDQYYVGAAKAFVDAAASKLQKLFAGISAELRVNGSIFRIDRDVRFGKDKRPHKDHLDFAFWEGDRKSAGSSLFLRISPDGIILGTGFDQGCPQRLKLFREAVAE